MVRFFLLAGFCLMLFALVAMFHTVDFGIPSLLSWDRNIASRMLGGTATSAVVFFGLAQWLIAQMEQRSRHCLEAAMEGVKCAYNMISGDEPSRNIAWVNGARLILRSQILASRVSEQDHKETWRLFKEEWRIRFLKFIDANVEYYFGIGKMESGDHTTLDEEKIQKLATQSVKKKSLNIETIHSDLTGSTRITLRSLKVIFDFVKEYNLEDDPLSKSPKIEEHDLEDVLGRDHYGLSAYLDTMDRYVFIGDSVKRKTDFTTEE